MQLPEKIGNWTKKPDSNYYYLSNLMALVSNSQIVFGTSIPVGVTIAKVNFNDEDEFIRILEDCSDLQKVKQLRDKQRGS